MRFHYLKYCALALMALSLIGRVDAQATLKPLGIGLEEVDYPYPVHFFDITVEKSLNAAAKSF
jgi:hypothetical protein